MFLATKGSQILEARRTGRTAVFLQFQSAESLSEDVETMDAFYELGLRVLQYTHHYDNAYSGGVLVKEWKGLTELGRKALERMNALGIVPDISHGNEVMGLEVCRLTKKPVIVSHTGCRALVNNARCVTDSVIRAVADTGGVVGIFSMSFWLTDEHVPTVDSYIRQLEHVIQIGGIDAVGVSNDYDVAGDAAAAKTRATTTRKPSRATFRGGNSMQGSSVSTSSPRIALFPSSTTSGAFTASRPPWRGRDTRPPRSTRSWAATGSAFTRKAWDKE